MDTIKQVYELLSGMTLWGILLRVILAGLVGGLVGSERGRHGRAAGLRTHILVCLGSTVTAMTGYYISTVLGLGGDPARISAQVISGIGFLGAGTILTRDHSRVTGLTTAAGLWATAAIGLAIGFGLYMIALPAFVVVILTNTAFPRMEGRNKLLTEGEFYLELSNIRCVDDFFDLMQGELTDLRVIPAKSATASHVGVLCRMELHRSAELLKQIRALDYMVIAVPMD